MFFRSRCFCRSALAMGVSALALINAAPAAAQTVSASQLEQQLNNLQSQINLLKAEQAQLNAEAAQMQAQEQRQAAVTVEQEKVAHQQAIVAHQQLVANNPRNWYVKTGDRPIPNFATKDGKSSFTIGGQVEVDAGLGGVPGQRGDSGGADFRRIEFYVEGVFDQHYVYKVEEDFSKTSTPLGGILDMYFGYQQKIGAFKNVFLVGNQHTPFGFQTDSNATLFLENDIGNTLFQDQRQLGITGQDYDRHWNAWYGITGTAYGAQSSAATALTSIDTGSTVYNSEDTVSGVLAYNIFNTPGHLLSIRDSLEYNRYNGNLDTANEPTFSSAPDLNVYGAKLISTGALPIQGALDESPRIDFEDGPLTLAAVYYDDQTYSNVIVSKKDPIHEQPKLTSWDIEAEYFLTDDHEPYSDYHGYYSSVDVHDPVTEGGPGAIQLAARLDNASLNDAKYSVHGGNETNLTLGVNWWPTSFTRVNLNYIRMFPIGGGKLVTNNDKSLNMVAVRLEFIY